MEEKEISLIQELASKDKELKQLWLEHLEYEKKLGELEDKLYLTPDDKVEKKRLQKLKLAGKDRIALILARYRKEKKQ